MLTDSGFLVLTKTEIGEKKEKSSKKVGDKKTAVLKKGKGERVMHSVPLMYLVSFTRVFTAHLSNIFYRFLLL